MIEPASGEARPTVLRYVALGDSYTIGTAVASEAERWPNRLVDVLGSGIVSLELVANLGVNGSMSRDLIADQLPALEAFRPGFASVLVGVNDVVQGVPQAVYRVNAGQILDTLLGTLSPSRIITVGTPDYTVTPQGAAYGDPAIQSSAIRATNAMLRELAGERGIAFVDIFDLSLRATADPSLVADDGLHPSGAQYALWVERIAPVVAGLLMRPGSGP
jgi:lysophospholipase L1-like esterase